MILGNPMMLARRRGYALPTFLRAAGANSTSIALPTHRADNLLVVVAVSNTNTSPSSPAGWSTRSITAGTAAIGMTVGFKVAASASETSGTWSGAVSLLAAVYSHGDYLAGGAGWSSNRSSSSTLTYPSRSFTGEQLVIGAGAVLSSVTGWDAGTALLTRRASHTGSARIVLLDSDVRISNYPGESKSLSGSSNWAAIIQRINEP